MKIKIVPKNATAINNAWERVTGFAAPAYGALDGIVQFNEDKFDELDLSTEDRMGLRVYSEFGPRLQRSAARGDTFTVVVQRVLSGWYLISLSREKYFGGKQRQQAVVLDPDQRLRIGRELVRRHFHTRYWTRDDFPPDEKILPLEDFPKAERDDALGLSQEATIWMHEHAWDEWREIDTDEGQMIRFKDPNAAFEFKMRWG